MPAEFHFLRPLWLLALLPLGLLLGYLARLKNRESFQLRQNPPVLIRLGHLLEDLESKTFFSAQWIRSR